MLNDEQFKALKNIHARLEEEFHEEEGAIHAFHKAFLREAWVELERRYDDHHARYWRREDELLAEHGLMLGETVQYRAHEVVPIGTPGYVKVVRPVQRSGGGMP